MAISVINVDGTTYPIQDNRISALPLSVSQGGTGATTVADAKTALSITDTKVKQSAITTSGGYPILLSTQSANRTQWTDGDKESYVDPAIAVNPAQSRVVVRSSTYSTGVGSGSGYNLYDVDNSKFIGAFQAGTQGTASTPGLTILAIGNSTTSGTAGNASGKIYIYGTNSGYAGISTSVGSTNRNYTIPDAGANADFVMTAGAQTISGNKTFSGTTYFANGTTYNVSSTGTGTFNSLEAKGNLYADKKIIGKSGTVSSGNYTTTVPTAAGTTGQIMFVLD